MDTELDQLLVEYTAERTSAAHNRCVVRLITSGWHSDKGLYVTRRLQYMKRQCSGFNLLEYEIETTGSMDAVNRIVNLNECADGIYAVMTCNESHDRETGYLDDYDLKLVPYVQVTKPT